MNFFKAPIQLVCSVANSFWRNVVALYAYASSSVGIAAGVTSCLVYVIVVANHSWWKLGAIYGASTLITWLLFALVHGPFWELKNELRLVIRLAQERGLPRNAVQQLKNLTVEKYAANQLRGVGSTMADHLRKLAEPIISRELATRLSGKADHISAGLEGEIDEAVEKRLGLFERQLEEMIVAHFDKVSTDQTKREILPRWNEALKKTSKQVGREYIGDLNKKCDEAIEKAQKAVDQLLTKKVQDKVDGEISTQLLPIVEKRLAAKLLPELEKRAKKFMKDPPVASRDLGNHKPSGGAVSRKDRRST